MIAGDRRKAILTVVGLCAIPVLCMTAWYKRSTKKYSTKQCRKEVIKNGEWKGVPTEVTEWDVIVVGAGPGGATTAYYLMNPEVFGLPKRDKPLKVLLLERKQFPRVKYCGEAWCQPALDILQEMGVMQEIERDKVYKSVERGGFISPFGYECIGGPYGSTSKIHTYAIKRSICDEYIARKAAEVGATLRENVDVTKVEYDTQKKHWRVICRSESDHHDHDDNENGSKNRSNGDDDDERCVLKSRMVIVADGSNSKIGTALGLIKGQPEAQCSQRYMLGVSEFATADGVMYFNKSSLPGYSATFRHFDDDIYLGTYILPGGKATSRVIPHLEQALLEEHPFFRATAPSDHLSFNGRIKVAPIRIGGVEKSYLRQLLLVGDAAGQVDPMTGEGIHTAMIAGKLAAQTTLEMFLEGDFSEASCSVYHYRWMRSFGFDFFWSSLGASLIYRFPILLDATCVYGAKRGQSFLDEFGEIMTGVKPKSEFAKLSLAVPISLEVIRQIFVQKILRRKPLAPDCAKELIESFSKK